MSKFKKVNRVLLSTDDLRDTAVINLGASKLASRFIGPFRVLKVTDDANTQDISSSLRLHSTFNFRRPIENRLDALHGSVSMPNAGSCN